ncbi:hypothetical protein [Mycetocola spongiae]|uniref:hypothetical protein n=1 Tax=Mycetocola spongiae TaxID=2859226 RepID=UPI001CF546C2|nr:hypothetical protein [Mycetocola spongiae]UCR89299.1 hypothetical protein KXZ72_00890 [Mycetocola spongiae]
MDSWNSFTDWLASTEARPVLFSVVVAAVAIIISGLIASLISRGVVRRLLAQRDREGKVAAIAALIDASTEAAVWSSLTPQEQVLADRAVGQADILIRLLPVRGSALAANWSSHQLAELKRHSATFGFELDPVIAEFRDRLIEWQNRPGRAKKIFEEDLGRWRFESTEPAAEAPAADRWVDARATTTPAEPARPFGVDAAAPTTTLPAAVTSPLAGADTGTQRLIDDVAAIEAVTPDSGGDRPTPHPL